MRLGIWVGVSLALVAAIQCANAQTAVSPVPPRPAAQKSIDPSAYRGMLDKVNTPEATLKAWQSMSVQEQWKTLEGLDRARSSVWYVIPPVPPKAPKPNPPKPNPTPAQPAKSPNDNPDIGEFRRRLDELQKALQTAAEHKAQVSLPAADEKTLSDTIKALEKSSQM